MTFLCLNTQGTSRARKLGRMRIRIRLAMEKNAFPAVLTTQAKENTKFYAAENTLLHNCHQATCPIKHLVCLYKHPICKGVFKLRMQMILHK